MERSGNDRRDLLSVADSLSVALETEGRRADAALREERDLLSSVLDAANVMILVLDPALRIVRANRLSAEILGDTIGRPFSSLFFTPEDGEQGRILLHGQGGEPFEHAWITGRATRVHVAWSARAMGVESKRFVITAIDATVRKSLEEQLLHDAFHDALTGLPNRALFMDRLGQSLRHANRRKDIKFAVLFLDLDRFKGVNDRLGHPTGDRLLIEIAERLARSVRPGDTAARLGGDEFTVLLEDVEDEADAAHIAERIQSHLKEPIAAAGEELRTTASIGIAMSETGYERPEDILRDADIAMYRAKSRGGARHEVFDRAMHARAAALLKKETEIRRAIEHGEFVVHYQPIVALRDGRIAGFEALVRWNAPGRGLLLPVEFLKTAEETSLVVEIDRSVLREACHRLQEWHRRYPKARPLSMSVNLSARQFTQPDLARQVDSALRAAGLHGDALSLEIPEGVLAEGTESANGTLEAIRRGGARLTLDDFGTGLSSLSHLHQFSIDALKIDRSFVGGIGLAGQGHEIVRTILSLAENLDLHVIAEGVETPEQLSALRALRCDYAQGYAFSKPVPAEEAEAMLAGRRPW